MARLLVFLILGPPIGMIASLYGLVPLANWVAGESQGFDPDWHQLVLLPLSYYLGAVPALLAGTFDIALFRRGIAWRPAWTALAAFVVSFLPLSTAFLMGYLHGPYVLLFGLVGVVPGFACSLLSDVVTRGR